MNHKETNICEFSTQRMLLLALMPPACFFPNPSHYPESFPSLPFTVLPLVDIFSYNKMLNFYIAYSIL